MIRILHVIATLDAAGAERQMAALCCRLNRDEFTPTVCALTRGGPLEALLRDAGVPVKILHKRGKWDLKVISRLRELIRQEKPDIVQTWLPTANSLGRYAAWKEHVPVIIASERSKDAWKGLARRAADRYLARRSRLILTNAQAVREFLIERIGIEAGKIEVIPNGIDLADFDAAAELEPTVHLPEPDGFTIGTVGRLEKQKGLAYLIVAFSKLPQDIRASLWIVGGGPLLTPLGNLTRALRVSERVHFLGPRSDIPALMRRFDLFVLSSLWEGLPNVVLEAMAARRAVLATNVDGTPEAVEDGKTGLLVPPARPDPLTAAMTKMLRNEDLRKRFGDAGRERVEREFSMELMVERTEAVYRRLAAEAGR